MKKTAATIIGLSFLALGVACGPSATPEGVCKHMEKLGKDAGEKAAEKGEMDECVKMMKELEKTNKAGFDKFAQCAVAAKDMKAAGECMTKMEPAGDEKAAEKTEKTE